MMYAGTLSYFAQLQAQSQLSALVSKVKISPIFNTDPNNPTQAISTVKALQLANAQGQQIYKIDQTNITEVLPKLHLSNDIKQDIQNSVNTGKYVITHTDNISVPGWNGAGYAIIDPLTGNNAYMISGGSNGGYYVGAYWGTFIALTILTAGLTGVVTSTGAILSASVIAELAIVRLIYEMYGLYPEVYGVEVQKCFASGFLVTIGIISNFVGFRGGLVIEAIEQYIGFNLPTNTGEQCLQ